MTVFAQDTPANISAAKLRDIFRTGQIEVRVGLGSGDKSYSVYTSDLSYDYVKINADYST